MYYEWLKKDPTEFIHSWVVNLSGKAVDVNGIHKTDYAKTEYSEPGKTEYGPAKDVNDIVNPKCKWTKHSKEMYEWAKEIISRNPSKYGL